MTRLLHVCLCGVYTDNYSYQENILPKFHKELGYEVYIIASTLSYDESGSSVAVDPGVYVNENDIFVTRLPYKKRVPIKVSKFLRIYEGLEEAIHNISPEIIFVHGCQFSDILIIKDYAKKNQVTIYVDNHADFSNSATNWLSKNIYHKVFWAFFAKSIEPYTKKFYGVLPARVDFLKDVYRLPSEKCELLVMGSDDELVEKAKMTRARERIRKIHNIRNNDFLIVTGGKIDKWKTQTLLLMQAVQTIKNNRVRLIIFGSIEKELEEKVKALTDGSRVQYIGWIQSKDSYDYFEAADLVVFPGRHSVMWEQVAGQGIPMLVKDWEGTHHVDLGGNVRFLTDDSALEIQNEIQHLLDNSDSYEKMRIIATTKGMEVFSYRKISKRAIEEKNFREIR